ncbi:MAG: NAD-dependent epimerase/dehydratase family protein [Alphaproteobacteria bacterium]|nr:NAD-dependent epimerase/dehydratase family protein [Alphaproteobacteria bacterium]
MAVVQLDSEGKGPARAVVIGARGFVGGAIADALAARGVECVRLTSDDVNLLNAGSGKALAKRIEPGDAVVVASAIAPCKDHAMFRDNIAMQAEINDALAASMPSHVLYVSSDAVYSDSPDPLTEESETMPDNLHGMMHVARETMLRASFPELPLACLRPTLIYGAGDPHNGYGPNRFRRLAQAGEAITLFGKGEERRDHVDVRDVAELGARMVMHRSSGALNAATGTVVSFMDIAKKMTDLADLAVEIVTTERQGPMPHNGYRPFDPSGVKRAFPDFAFTQPEQGFERLYAETADG